MLEGNAGLRNREPTCGCIASERMRVELREQQARVAASHQRAAAMLQNRQAPPTTADDKSRQSTPVGMPSFP